jgi:hypothetical protein
MKQIIYSMLPLLNVNLLLILLLLSTQSCKQATEPRLEPELTLTLEDVSCTEAWMQLKTTNLQLPATLTLYKNNVAQNNILCYGDTLLYIDSLLPNQTYKIKVSSIQYPASPEETSSNELTVTTMDTTSHNFTWQSWEFGECGSSSLYDVAIIDENNIWAVGEIYIRDSLGNCDPNAYNAVHWDGTKWELKRIYHYSSCNPVDYPPFKSIVAFSDTEIVLTSGGSIGWFNGKMNRTDCGIRPLLTGAINKLWGSSSEDLYAVGNNGNIAHWDGVSWRKIESGTTLNIYDIYSDNGEIICIASGKFISSGKKVLSIRYGSTSEINSVGLSDNLSSIWFKSRKKYYIAGAGIYWSKSLKYANWEKINTQNTRYCEKIRGNNYNDIFIAGSYNLILHYNGYSWYEYTEYGYSENLSLDFKGNTMVTVGWENEQARIVMGRR